MRLAGIAEVKARLTALLRQVKAGEEIVITERGVPVARLAPLEGATGRDGRLERLVRAGIVIPPRRPKRRLGPPPPTDGPGLLAALLAERDENDR